MRGHAEQGFPLVLGLDPGFAHLGYALVRLNRTEEQVLLMGVVKTDKSDKKQRVLAASDNLRRAQEIATALDKIRLYYVEEQWHVRMVAAEAMSFPRSASVAAKMAMAWGVIAAMLTRCNLPITQPSPQEIKRQLCGSKSAPKEDVQAALGQRYGHRKLARLVANVPVGQHEHAYDALAAVVTSLQTDIARAVRSSAPA